MLVAGLPLKCCAKPALVPALRKRLEYIWIHQLQVSLNKKRFLHNSFSGDFAARSSEVAVDSQAL